MNACGMEEGKIIYELPATLPVRKRRRPALSCLACRRRKVKCDREQPCDQCKKIKNSACTYKPEGLAAIKSHVHQTSYPSHTSSEAGEKLTNNDRLSESNPEVGSRSYDKALETFHDDTTSSTGKTDLYSQASSSHIGHDLVRRMGRIEDLLSSTNLLDQMAGMGASEKPSYNAVRGNMMKNRYYGPSHWMTALFDARSFMGFDFSRRSDAMVALRNKEAEAVIHSSFQKCKIMARAIKAVQTPQWTVHGYILQHSMPPRAVADELVGNYLRTHESIHRILHIPSFQKEYTHYWDNQTTASTVSLMKIILVMAIGVCFYQGPDIGAYRPQAIHWIHTARSWLASPMEKSRLQTATIQVECLLLLARSIFNVGADHIWSHTGSVLRSAMSMGFHRDPSRFSGRYSSLHAEIRRRLWATILEINLQACLSSGMSPMISEDDYDTEIPSNINDDEISDSTELHPIQHPAEVFTQSSLQILMMKSLTIRLKVIKLVNLNRVEGSYKEVLKLDKELSQNHKHAYNFLARAAQDLNARHRPTTFQLKIIDLKTQHFLLNLHRDFAAKARNDPQFYYSHKIYLSAALAVHSHPITSPTAPSFLDTTIEDDFARFRLMTDGFLKELIIHSVIIIYQEMISPLEETLPVLFPSSDKPSRDPCEDLLKGLVDLASRRLAVGETSPKTYMLYSIAYAHINALEREAPTEESMIEAVITSLAQCQEILKKRLAASAVGEDQFFDGIGGLAQDVNLAGEEDWGMEFEGSDSWLFAGWQAASVGEMEF